MISSPCKLCDRRDQSKETCYKDCTLLQGVQDIACVAQKDLVAYGIDTAEDGRFAIHLSESVLLDRL